MKLKLKTCEIRSWRATDLTAEAMAVNQASRRVMEKAGLTLVRTFHQPWPYPVEGEEFGDVEYALDKADWQHDHAGAVGWPPT